MLRKMIQTKVTLKRDFKPPITLLNTLKQAAGPKDSVLAIAWERENGYISRYDLPLPARAEDLPEVAQLAERIVKFLLWASGGWRLMLAGPSSCAGRSNSSTRRMARGSSMWTSWKRSTTVQWWWNCAS